MIQEEPYSILYSDSCMYRNEMSFLDTKLTTVITMSSPTNSGSSTTKFMLIVFYLVFSMSSVL